MAEVNEGFTISRDQNGMGITVHIGPNTKILIEGTPDTQVENRKLQKHTAYSLRSRFFTPAFPYLADKRKFPPVSSSATATQIPFRYSLGSDGRWVATTDGHDFEGVVTRDLLRLCSGCPAF